MMQFNFLIAYLDKLAKYLDDYWLLKQAQLKLSTFVLHNFQIARLKLYFHATDLLYLKIALFFKNPNLNRDEYNTCYIRFKL